MKPELTTRRECFVWLGGALLVSGFLAGCGGAGDTMNVQSGTRKGKAVFTVVWPATDSRLIPMASKSIRVTISDATSEIDSKVLVRPGPGGTASVTFEALPVGPLTAAAVAYPSEDGTGIAQAQASVGIEIVADQTTTMNLTMNSTIDHLEVTPNLTTVDDVMPRALTVSPRDQNGRLVLVSSSTMTWSSSNSSVATVSETGTVRGIAGGAVTITARESESGKSVNVNLTVQELSVFPLYVGQTLTPGLDLLLNTSGGRTDWLTDRGGYFEANYPTGQDFGFIAISTYPVTPVPAQRQTLNLEKFSYLALEMKGASGDLDIGVKTATDPDLGQEPKRRVSIGPDWQTYHIALSSLVGSAPFTIDRMKRLYILCELVFEQNAPSQLFFRNVRFEKSGELRGEID